MGQSSIRDSATNKSSVKPSLEIITMGYLLVFKLELLERNLLGISKIRFLGRFCECPDVICQAQTSKGHACYFTEPPRTVEVASPSIVMTVSEPRGTHKSRCLR